MPSSVGGVAAPAPTAPGRAPAAGSAPRTRNARPAASAARFAATSARGWSCAAYQWWAISAGARPGGDQLRLGLDRLGVAGVQPGVLAGQQVVVHRLADQRVPELVAAVRVDDDQLGRHDRAAAPTPAPPRRCRRPGPAARGRTGCRRPRPPAAPAGPARAAGRPGTAAGRAGCVGMSPQPPGRPEAANCSMKNGLPWARSLTASTVRGVRLGAEQVRRASRRCRRGRAGRARSARTPRTRSSSARNGRSGWPRCSSSVR